MEGLYLLTPYCLSSLSPKSVLTQVTSEWLHPKGLVSPKLPDVSEASDNPPLLTTLKRRMLSARDLVPVSNLHGPAPRSPGSLPTFLSWKPHPQFPTHAPTPVLPDHQTHCSDATCAAPAVGVRDPHESAKPRLGFLSESVFLMLFPGYFLPCLAFHQCPFPTERPPHAIVMASSVPTGL